MVDNLKHFYLYFFTQGKFRGLNVDVDGLKVFGLDVNSVILDTREGLVVLQKPLLFVFDLLLLRADHLGDGLLLKIRLVYGPP